MEVSLACGSAEAAPADDEILPPTWVPVVEAPSALGVDVTPPYSILNGREEVRYVGSVIAMNKS